MKDVEKEKRERRRRSLGLGVKSSIYPLDEKQTAIGAAQTCVSSLGIGRRLVAHQGPSLSFAVQMGEEMEVEDEEEEEGGRHLYFIGLDAGVPVKTDVGALQRKSEWRQQTSSQKQGRREMEKERSEETSERGKGGKESMRG